MQLLIILGRHSVNDSREIRHSSISNLQRILLGSPLIKEVDQTRVEEVFNRVVFPLVDELLKPQVASKDPQGMIETRIKGSALLCKVFIQLELRESRAETDFRLLWIQVLDLLDRLMHVNRGDQLVSQHNYASIHGAYFSTVRSGPRIIEKHSSRNECRWHFSPTWNTAKRTPANSLDKYTRKDGTLPSRIPP